MLGHAAHAVSLSGAGVRRYPPEAEVVTPGLHCGAIYGRWWRSAALDWSSRPAKAFSVVLLTSVLIGMSCGACVRSIGLAVALRTARDCVVFCRAKKVHWFKKF